MSNLFRRWAALAVLASATTAWAAPASAGPCDDAYTQLEINECAHRQFLKADAKLNKLWPGIKRSADQMGAGDTLLDSQRKWISFRDSACAAEAAPYNGGSFQSAAWSFCLTRQTKRRIKDFKMFVE